MLAWAFSAAAATTIATLAISLFSQIGSRDLFVKDAAIYLFIEPPESLRPVPEPFIYLTEMPWWRSYHWLPGAHWYPSGRPQWLWLPLWIPSATLIAASILWWRSCGNSLFNPCRKCNYDLTGNVSRRCPECGSVIVAQLEAAEC